MLTDRYERGTGTALPPWHCPRRTHASCPKAPTKPRERRPLGTPLASTWSRAGVWAARQPSSCPAAFWRWQSWDSTGRRGAAGRWLLCAGNRVPWKGEAPEEQKQLQYLKAGASRPNVARFHRTQVTGAAQPVPEEAASDSLTAGLVTNAGIRQKPECCQRSRSSNSKGSPEDTSRPGPETRSSQLPARPRGCKAQDQSYATELREADIPPVPVPGREPAPAPPRCSRLPGAAPAPGGRRTEPARRPRGHGTARARPRAPEHGAAPRPSCTQLPSV